MVNESCRLENSDVLNGLGIALVTPFDEDGSIDFKSLERLIEYHLANGLDYYVVLGTTAETPTLSKKEKADICNFIKDKVNKRVPLVLGLGGNCTSKLTEEVKETDLSGFSAILSVAPYYNRPSQEGLYLHYKSLSEVSPLPIILYNVPGRTGVNVNAETTLRLADACKNIIGIKEASGNIEQIRKIIERRPEGFKVLSGDDALGLELIKIGADGVISVAGNAFPKKYSEIVHKALAGEYEAAHLINETLLPIYETLFCDGNPAGVKAYLTFMGYIKNVLRLPLVPVTNDTEEKISKIVGELV